MNGRIKKTVVMFAAAVAWGSSIYAVADTNSAEDTQTIEIQTESTQEETEMPAEEIDGAVGNEGVSYYLNMKKNENLLKIYEEAGSLLDEKETICQIMYEEGEATKLDTEQIRTSKTDIQEKKQICTNEIRFDQYYLEEKDLNYKGIRITDDKSLGTIESCTAKYPDIDKFLAASCVTECENARAGIHAQEAKLSYLEQAYQNTVLLQEAGEASRMDVIDIRLSVLDASMQLQSLYYDMNLAYYTVAYAVEK